MKKKRTIIIKHPILRAIRNNFREVIFKACSTNQQKIHEKKHQLRENRSSYGDDDFGRLSSELSRSWWTIERPLRASILLCPVCFQVDKDMTYNPIRENWYCTECYAELRDGFTEEGRPEEFPWAFNIRRY